MWTAILCDLDGTLIDAHVDIAAAFRQALRRVVAGPLPPPAAIARHIGKPLLEMAAALGYPLSPPQDAAFLRFYRQAAARRADRATRPYPGVRETLQRLSPLAFAVVTTKETAQARAVLQRLQLAPFFCHVQGWEPGLRLKPAPDTVYAALAALRCPPAAALLVGDTAADILAGKAAGVATCAATYGFGDLQALRQARPDYWLAAFADLIPLVRRPPAPAGH
ncbi:MAG: hydrolase [Candidatus Tectimicrobiota bacterium]|nr:MAG: hydrolase [Candidatus Tectomicrobia bacterium]